MRKCLALALFLFMTLQAHAESLMILVVGDLNNAQATVVEAQLREKLRHLRNQQRLKLAMGSYNFAIREHGDFLKKMHLDRGGAPILAVCEIDDRKIPRSVVFSETVHQVDESAAHLMSYLRGVSTNVPDSDGPGDLALEAVEVNPGTIMGVLNVKVKLRNPGSTTVVGPFQIQLSLKPEGGEWKVLSTQILDKVPAGYNITRDFVPHDVAEVLKRPFTVRVEVLQDNLKMLEREVRHAGTEVPEGTTENKP